MGWLLIKWSSMLSLIHKGNQSEFLKMSWKHTIFHVVTSKLPLRALP